MLQNVKVNLSGVTRHDTMAGKDYLVAPAIMIVEGVLNGNHGPLLYPADELKKSVPLWNSKPAVLYHPQKDGQGVSACDPDIITNRGLGVLMNTRIEDVVVDDDKLSSLKTEVWLDMERVKEIDEDVLTAVENGDVMELSTGLFTDDEDTSGEFNGKHYDAVARNYRPDHLAILPDEIGACSIEDGAGFLRLNKAGDKLTFVLKDSTLKDRMWLKENKDLVHRVINKHIREFLKNEMSDSDRRQLLQSLLNDKFPDEDFGLWIDDIFSDDDFFIYENDGKLFKQEFEEDDGEVSFKGIPEAVKKIVNFEPILNRKDVKMNKKKTIDALISNEKTLWSEDNREWLLTQDKDILANMVPVENDDDDDANSDSQSASAAAAEKAKKAEASAESQAAGGAGEAAPETTANKEVTVDEYIDQAPKAIQDMLRNGMASHKADKKRLINIITANDANSFTDEILEGKTLEELQKIAQLARNAGDPEPTHANNYGGQGDTIPLRENTEEPLGLPTMNFNKPVAVGTD